MAIHGIIRPMRDLWKWIRKIRKFTFSFAADLLPSRMNLNKIEIYLIILLVLVAMMMVFR